MGESGDQGTEASPETPVIEAPPERADRHSERVMIGHVKTEDSAHGRPEDEAHPETDGGPVEPWGSDRALRFPNCCGIGRMGEASPTGWTPCIAD
jgi:hypothetical protein